MAAKGRDLCRKAGCSDRRHTSKSGARYPFCKRHQQEAWRKQREAQREAKRAGKAAPKATAPVAPRERFLIVDYDGERMQRVEGRVVETIPFAGLRRSAPQPHVIGLLAKGGYRVAVQRQRDELQELTALSARLEQIERYLRGHAGTLIRADDLFALVRDGIEPPEHSPASAHSVSSEGRSPGGTERLLLPALLSVEVMG